MILFTENKLNVVTKDLVMLDTESSYNIYISLHTYKEAVILSDRFESELSGIKRILDTRDNHVDAVNFFFENAPEPLNILAAFLGLVDENIKLEMNLEAMCGILHQMSMIIDFENYVAVPIAVRKNVVFSKSMLNGWKESWSDIQKKISIAEIDLESITIDFLATILNRLGLSVSEVRSDRIFDTTPTNYTSRVSNELQDDDSDDEGSEDMFDMFNKMMAEELEKEDQDTQVVAVDEGKIDIEKESAVEETTVDKEKQAIDSIILAFGGSV